MTTSRSRPAQGQLNYFLATSSGVWQSHELATGEQATDELKILDVDQRLGGDLVLADSTAGEVRLFLNEGTASFAAPLVYRVAGPYDITPAASRISPRC